MATSCGGISPHSDSSEGAEAFVLLDLKMHQKRIWVTGSSGLIGSAVCRLSSRVIPDFEFVPMTRQRLDLTDHSAIREVFRSERPSGVIHCAAISRSPLCRNNPALAEQVNVEATRVLHEAAEDVPFIFFSSDLVFDGTKGNYSERDSPNPLGVYADTKVRAEGYVLRNPQHTVVRTSLNAGMSPSGDRSFVEEIRQALWQGKLLKLFTDEFRCPVPAEFTALAVLSLLRERACGIYHIAGGERLSRYEIGVLTAKMFGADTSQIVPGTLEDYEGDPRPADTSLNCLKLQQLIVGSLPSFSDWTRETRDFAGSDAKEIRR